MAEKVTADSVKSGDFLPYLDNGYVVEVETGDAVLSTASSQYHVSMGEKTVITFHDQLGNEQYLVLDPEFEIEVSR